MSSGLEAIFGELGLTQYLHSFVEQGFDAWEIILDIQESDLDALGVKLGHRRKLQRRIANARGIAPSVSLASPLTPTPEDSKLDGARPELGKPESSQDGQGVAKRKYRRHPKPDDKAPDRPPSAYVLFSNKMREDLKSQNLSFTEIAKLVGENWQNLAPAEKEAYESQANADKEKYHRDLMAYKKTAEYRKYMQYLQEFKEKQAKNQANDSSKRPRLEPARLRHGSSSSSVARGGNVSSNSGSGSERLQGSEPPPSRQERINSTTSITESRHASTTPTLMSPPNPSEDAIPSPGTVQYGTGSPGESQYGHIRPSLWRDGGRGADVNHRHLPSLSDMLDDGRMSMPIPTASEGNPYSSGFVAANRSRGVPELPNVLPAVPSRPLLRNEHSSNGSLGSISPATSFSRTPGEGPLPIHALLSNNPIHVAAVPGGTPALFDRATPPSLVGGASPSPTEGPKQPFGYMAGPRGYGFHATPTTSQFLKAERTGDGDALMMPAPDLVAINQSGPMKTRLDGMSALLRAGEIVERHDQDDRNERNDRL
ncbi:hypothetical protein G7046_g9 [Stylonectria norvegica]|nr:hypothetical protein G7046_g9 [Stylonectria norvegica]